MGSVPVGETILRAWSFAGRRLLPLIGAAWLPTVFYGVALAYLLGKLSGTMLVWPRPDAGNFDNFSFFYLFCIVVVTALVNAVIAVPMSCEALEPGGEWKSAYLSIAWREWLLFSNLLLLYIVIIAVMSALVFAGNVGIAVSTPMIGQGGVWQGIGWPPIMEGLLALVAVGTGLFLAVRFGFFLSTIAVADAPTRLLQAWMLSRRNFWRLLTVSLGLLVPVVVVCLLVAWAMVGSEFGTAATALAAAPHDKTPLFQMIGDHGAAIGTIWAIGFLVWNAIFAGGAAEAYGKVEHAAEVVTTREYISVAEPAFAVATVSPHAAVADLKRVEPEFAAAEPEATAFLERSGPGNAVDGAKPKESETKAANMLPEELAAMPVVAAGEDGHPEHETITETEHLTETGVPEITPDIAEHHEPLAPQEALPAMDPLGHAAPAAPDPSGAPTTPLPSFVQAQPSRTDGSSEAA